MVSHNEDRVIGKRLCNTSAVTNVATRRRQSCHGDGEFGQRDPTSGKQCGEIRRPETGDRFKRYGPHQFDEGTVLRDHVIGRCEAERNQQHKSKREDKDRDVPWINSSDEKHGGDGQGTDNERYRRPEKQLPEAARHAGEDRQPGRSRQQDRRLAIAHRTRAKRDRQEKRAGQDPVAIPLGGQS